MGLEKSLLPPEQRKGLHKSILGYLQAQIPRGTTDDTKNTDHVIQTLAQWLQVEDIPSGSEDAVLLPRKWNAIVRLQRRIIELERRVRQLSEENDALQAQGPTLDSIPQSSLDWVPRLQPNFHVDVGFPVTSIKLHPTLPLVFVATDHGKLQCYDLMSYTMPLASVQAHMRGITCIDVLLEEGGHCLVATASKDLHCKVFRLNGSNLELIRTFTGHEHIVSHARIWKYRTDTLIATCSRDLTCKIWDLSNGWCLKSFQAHTDWVRCLDVVGEYIVTGSNDCTVRLSHWPSGRGLSLGLGHGFPVESLKIIPLEVVSTDTTAENLDGSSTANDTDYTSLGFKHIVSTSRDNTACIWLVPLPKFVPHRPPQPNPTRSQFTLIKQLKGHSSWVRDVRIRGNHVFTCSDDRSVRIWDSSSGECLRTLTDIHSGFVNCLDLDCRGLNRQLLVTGGADGQLQVFLK